MSGLTRLDGKVAIITGAAGGIGQAIARLLGERGATVVLTDKDPAVLELEGAFGPDALVLTHDVTSVDDATAVVARVRERFGRLDVLVNNAGWDRPSLFADSDPADWLRIVQINYLGVVTGSYADVRAAGGARRRCVVSMVSETAASADGARRSTPAPRRESSRSRNRSPARSPATGSA